LRSVSSRKPDSLRGYLEAGQAMEETPLSRACEEVVTLALEGGPLVSTPSPTPRTEGLKSVAQVWYT
jgi:hypothetical protein